jgi:hypothetical protein
MPGEIYPELVFCFLVAVALNTLALGGLLAFFQPGDGGFFARNGVRQGWGICLGMIIGLNILALPPVPLIVPIVLWWILALVYLKLTIRQTLKINIALGLFWWLCMFALVLVFV